MNEFYIEETCKIKVYCTIISKNKKEALKLLKKKETNSEDQINIKTMKRWKILTAGKLIE